MEISVLALLGIALATMFFGYFFGLFEGRGQGYKRRAKDGLDEGQVKPIAPAVVAPPAAAPRRTGLLELAMSDAGRPQLFVDGREVDAEAVTPEARRRLIDLMVLLRPWVEPRGSTPPVAASGARPERAPAAPLQSPAPRIDRGLPIPPGPTAPPVGAPTSLVGQIDSLLQMRLVGSPLAERGIRLAESLHGGAIVFVGSTQYDGVDKVPDAAIQGVIRAAIAEWEEKFPPK